MWKGTDEEEEEEEKRKGRLRQLARSLVLSSRNNGHLKNSKPNIEF